MSQFETEITADPAALEALAPIVGWAFGNSARDAQAWLERASAGGQVRIARSGAQILGGLVEIPMGQWFGAKSVPTLGLAGVAIAPEARGAGSAVNLLRDTLRAGRSRGLCLSTLYPSTFSLYRKLGYELAGSHCRFTLQLRQLPRARRALRVEPLAAEAQAEVEQLYRDVARHRPGYLDRGLYIWRRVQNPDREPGRCFGVHTPEGLAAYAFARARPSKGAPLELVVSDLVTRNPEASRSLFAFLADHSSTAEHAIWHGGPADVQLLGLPGPVVKVNIDDYWMLRLVDVPAALLARGYPPIDAAVDLEVSDELLPENAGRHSLVVRGGRAEIAAASRLPAARLDVGALSALYSGFMSPRDLKLAGKLDADDQALSALSMLFAGAAPGLPDFF